MVYLKRIETKGFKSMGPSLVSVPVERGLVSITGPNGSGKSNLLDAILFGLGENSAKTLRAQSLSALIYDGSADEPKPSSAKVSLQFDNTDRKIPVDYDTVTISRELKSSGESTYMLNGKHIQRNALSDVLEMALINSRGLNIVLQGMITRISELVPDEKRKLIEGIVGVAQFDEKKQAALKELSDADNKLAVAMAKIEEIRDQVQRLEEQRNDQLRLKQIEQNIRWLKAVSASTKLSAVRRTIELRVEAERGYGEKLKELEQKQLETRSAIEELEKKREELVASAVSSGTAQIEAEIGSLRSDLMRLREQRDASEKEIDTLSQVLPVMSGMVRDQAAKISQCEETIQNLKKKLEGANLKKSELSSVRVSLRREKEKLDSEINRAQMRRNQLLASKEAYESKITRAKRELDSLENQIKGALDHSNSLDEKARFFAENIASVERGIADLEPVLRAQKSDMESLRDSKIKLEKLQSKLEQQLDIALRILERARTEVIKYDSDVGAIERIAPDEVAISRLSEEIEKRGMEDVYYGPLEHLIDFAPLYSKAIISLGRDWLNALVVSDLNALTKTAEIARELGAKRIKIIPLKEVQGSKSVRLTSLGSKKTGRRLVTACDAISCDPKFRAIVNFVFGDAFIVDNAKQAYVVAQRGFRAVSLRGEIFEPDVLAFETGYSKRFASVADLLRDEKGFAHIRSALDSLKSLIEKRKTSLSTLRVKSSVTQDSLSTQSVNISQSEARLEASKQEILRYKEYASSLVSKKRDALGEIDRLRQKHKRVEKLHSGYVLGLEKLSEIISSSNLQVFDPKVSELASRKADLDLKEEALEREIRELGTELTRAEGDIENNQRPALERLEHQKIQTERNLASKKEFLGSSEPKLRELEERYESLRIQEQEILERANKFKPILEGLDGKLKHLRAELDLVQRSLFSTQKELDSARIDLERLKESESILSGEIAMNGYSTPIAPFDGADELLKELLSESSSLSQSVNHLADQTYRQVFDDYKHSSVRYNELEKDRNAIVTFIETIDAEKRKVFIDAYERVNKELRSIFNKMTNGAAWLELENPDEIFEGGIFLMTQFPGQLPRDSSSVSGGQKTVSALSFIMAIQSVFPSPFYVFDEVDAALDSIYSAKMAEILAERSSTSQIIIVSLKDSVVAKATTVIGVYMSNGNSRVLRYKNALEVPIPT